MATENLTIGSLAKAADVHVETVRYYQRRGLMVEPKRQSGSVRRYGEGALRRLRFIRRAQELGFTLKEIKVLVRLGETPSCRDAKLLAARKLALVESRLDDLRRMRSSLRALIVQCESGAERSCPIIECLSR